MKPRQVCKWDSHVDSFRVMMTEYYLMNCLTTYFEWSCGSLIHTTDILPLFLLVTLRRLNKNFVHVLTLSLSATE